MHPRPHTPSLLPGPTRRAALGLAAGLTLLGGALARPVQESESDDWTVFAEVLHTAPGESLQNVLIQGSGGKIRAILPGRSATEDAVRAAHVTAGMVDASARITPGAEAVEQSSEVVTNLSVLDALDLFDPRWDRQARAGVTTVMITPPDENVIGGFGAVLKTGGPRTLEARLLEGTPILRGAIGNQPSGGNSPAFGRPRSYFNRRPTTRMGVEWEWRNAFFKAAQAERFPEVDFEGADVLRAVLAGDVTLCIQAWATQDIRTAIFLKEELAREGFGDVRLMIDAGAEAWKEPDLVRRNGTPIVLPPFDHDGRTVDQAFMAWDVAKRMLDLGLPVALSAHGDTSPADRLAMQASYAIRGGLDFDQALAAVTTTPAQLLGVEDRVGTVEVGKDADLVLWNGTPFEPTARITGVLAAGELVLDPR